MFCSSVPLRSRIPDIGHQTTATLKWATYTFWYLLDPILHRHHRYYRRKVQLDRFLERNSIMANSMIGVILGVTVYFSIVCGVLLPPAVGAKEHTMKENAREVLNLMECDTSKELPAYQLMRVKREIIGKLHAVADEAEVRRQREEAVKLSELLKSLS